MDYDYNYGCLKQCIELLHLKKNDILKAFDIKDYTTLNKWINGNFPLNTKDILSFCNCFNVPVHYFYFDQDGMPGDTISTTPGIKGSTLATISNGPQDITPPIHYRYNSGFLKGFMENFHLLKVDILKALGTKDYVSLNKWLEGAPIHTKALLRFCNYFNVPLCNFFLSNDGNPCDFAPTMPGPDDQITPTGESNRDRGISDIHIISRNPNTPEMVKAVNYGLGLREAQLKKRKEALIHTSNYKNGNDPEENDQLNEPSVMIVTAEERVSGEGALRMRNMFLEEIREIEQKHRQKENELYSLFNAERSRLLTIIEKQQETIAHLSAK